jgi:hypothetical protein
MPVLDWGRAALPKELAPVPAARLAHLDNLVAAECAKKDPATPRRVAMVRNEDVLDAHTELADRAWAAMQMLPLYCDSNVDAETADLRSSTQNDQEKNRMVMGVHSFLRLLGSIGFLKGWGHAWREDTPALISMIEASNIFTEQKRDAWGHLELHRGLKRVCDSIETRLHKVVQITNPYTNANSSSNNKQAHAHEEHRNTSIQHQHSNLTAVLTTPQPPAQRPPSGTDALHARRMKLLKQVTSPGSNINSNNNNMNKPPSRDHNKNKTNNHNAVTPRQASDAANLLQDTPASSQRSAGRSIQHRNPQAYAHGHAAQDAVAPIVRKDNVPLSARETLSLSAKMKSNMQNLGGNLAGNNNDAAVHGAPNMRADLMHGTQMSNGHMRADFMHGTQMSNIDIHGSQQHVQRDGYALYQRGSSRERDALLMDSNNWGKKEDLGVKKKGGKVPWLDTGAVAEQFKTFDMVHMERCVTYVFVCVCVCIYCF